LAELSAIAIEKARLYERLGEVENQLRKNEKLSVLGLLAAEVAHEIRNPPAAMQMLYHSLDLRFPDGDPRARDARTAGPVPSPGDRTPTTTRCSGLRGATHGSLAHDAAVRQTGGNHHGCCRSIARFDCAAERESGLSACRPPLGG
jgi:signal transduction histidine kinase